jgi:hypothetical protein
MVKKRENMVMREKNKRKEEEEKTTCIKKLLNVHSRRPSPLPSVETINKTRI